MRFLTLVVALTLAVDSVIGATLSGSSSNGYMLYTAGSMAACIQSNGGCNIGDTYSSSSQNAVLITGAASNTYQVTFNTISQIGNLNVSFNDAVSNPSSSFLNIVINQGLSAVAISVGPYASIMTSGSQTQNGLQLVVGYLNVAGSINSNAYSLTVNYATTMSGGSLTVGALYASGTSSFSSATVHAAVGFKNSAATTLSNTNIYANKIWFAQNGGSATYFGTCSNGGVIQSTLDLTFSSPQVITGCNILAGGNIVIIPAPPTKKRDGSTLATVFNGGTSSSNRLVQSSSYSNSPLFKREAEGQGASAGQGAGGSASNPPPSSATNPPTTPPTPSPNSLQISNSHRMVVSSSISQTGSSTTFVPDCSSVMTCQFASTVSQIAAECPGCYFNPSCPQTYVAACG